MVIDDTAVNKVLHEMTSVRKYSITDFYSDDSQTIVYFSKRGDRRDRRSVNFIFYKSKIDIIEDDYVKSVCDNIERKYRTANMRGELYVG